MGAPWLIIDSVCAAVIAQLVFLRPYLVSSDQTCRQSLFHPNIDLLLISLSLGDNVNPSICQQYVDTNPVSLPLSSFLHIDPA